MVSTCVCIVFGVSVYANISHALLFMYKKFRYGFKH